MTPDLQRVLERYIESGWVNASSSVGGSAVAGGQVHPAYLILATDMVVLPRLEVQVTMRCHRLFRAHKMVVAEDSARFNLIDLKIGNRSQFSRAEDIQLRDHVALVCGVRQEVHPEPIRWPLEVCTYGTDVSARAIIPDGREEDLGAEFEVILLGETVAF